MTPKIKSVPRDYFTVLIQYRKQNIVDLLMKISIIHKNIRMDNAVYIRPQSQEKNNRLKKLQAIGSESKRSKYICEH